MLRKASAVAADVVDLAPGAKLITADRLALIARLRILIEMYYDDPTLGVDQLEQEVREADG